MTRVIIGPALVPRSPRPGGISLRMFALICSFLLSAMMWSGLFFLISGRLSSSRHAPLATSGFSRRSGRIESR